MVASTASGFHAFGGNMPFLGGRRIATQHGEVYAEWLTQKYGGTGDTDYVGYFFHRAAELLAPAGTLGFIATNAIADGDNRRTVLAPLVRRDPPFEIYRCETGMPWPGNAQVLIATLFLARELPSEAVPALSLNSRGVARINSRLRAGEEWPDPAALPENQGYALVGCFLRGEGFVLSKAEAEAHLAAHPHEAAVVRPFVVGDDLNKSPDQSAQRFVIDFADMTLEQAERFPAALAIVRERVCPVREQLKATGADADHRKYWWRFANTRRELRERATTLPRLLATARVSKHLSFCFVPSTWVPSEQVVVFPLATFTAFAVLQSRVHAAWIDLQATHMGEGIRYSASDCFATFPFPVADPATTLERLETAGERFYEARSRYARASNQGVTLVASQLRNPECRSPEISELRRLYEDLDRAVVAAYGWFNLEVPPLCSESATNRTQVVAFLDDVMAALFALGQARADSTLSSERSSDDPRPASTNQPGIRAARRPMKKSLPRKVTSAQKPEGKRRSKS